MSWSRDINTGDIPCIILAGDILQSAGQLDKQISKLGKEIVARGGSACMRACVRAGGRLSYYICFICFVAFYLFDCDLLLLLLLITSFSFIYGLLYLVRVYFLFVCFYFLMFGVMFILIHAQCLTVYISCVCII